MVLHLIGAPAHRATLGPSPWYRLEEERLLQGPDNALLLLHEGDSWTHNGVRFSSVVCQGPVACHFDHGAVEGPFATLTLVNGVLWGDHASIARYDRERRRWMVMHTGAECAAADWRPV